MPLKSRYQIWQSLEAGAGKRCSECGVSDVVSLLGVQNTMPGAAEFQPPPAPAGRSPRSTVARCVTSRFSLSLSPRSLSCPVLSLWSAFVWPTSVQSLWSRMEMIRLVERLRGFSQRRERQTDRLWDRERKNLCVCGRGEWGVYVPVKFPSDFAETRL